ncbi:MULTISPECIES: hemin-degrading factor [unclassified Haematospirillum]|uniref:hemin-degrading factor n=1 Tax=unclassified Haematospirillum TaxID=2622088 RepID=UPI00143C466D|nr:MULTISPECIES: ChuX/HutX family heme-like substrate-binding protein [unclassified Haematospirillum]NKD55366.1 hemin-degrading factor [Haematospirillum sp. H4890]NKD75585.1 hemin-degrading factor [Haematospirillum sp. H4485]NKD88331.1 hemin-degrading factor [Haematospirillum sp. 15-248]
MTSQSPATTDLQHAWASLASGTARRYARDLAADLGSTEAQLVAAGCGHDVVRLDADWAELIQALPALGPVKVITRNNAVVHEKTGAFGNINISGGSGVVYNGGIDLRLFLGRWHHGFSVKTENQRGIRRSLQFFDLDGTAVHKVFLTADGNVDAWARLTEQYRSDNQSTELNVVPARTPVERPDDQIDVEGLRAHWSALRDVHHFHDMLREFGVDRLQAMRLVGPDLALQTSTDALRRTLDMAVNQKAPLMVFVGSAGCIQIHTGTIQRVMEKDGWLNIMDPDFNLHVRSEEIAGTWVVRKPSINGIITTLELYDTQGRNVAILCGKRHGQEPEREDWRAIVKSLPGHDRHAAVA